MDKEAEIVRRIVAADTDDFAALLALAGLDPKEDLCGLDLSGLSLVGADLSGADLSETDFRKANLRGARLAGANLCGADLTGADLSEADLRGACLTNAVVSSQQIASACGDMATMLPQGVAYPSHWRRDRAKPVMADGTDRLNKYRSAHSELRQMIDDLRALLTMEELRIRPNARMAHELGLVLVELVREQLTHDDPKVKSMAWGFIGGKRPLSQVIDDYHKRWLKSGEFNFGDDFVAATLEVFEMVEQRLEREEQQVLSSRLVFREAGVQSAPSDRSSEPLIGPPSVFTISKRIGK